MEHLWKVLFETLAMILSDPRHNSVFNVEWDCSAGRAGTWEPRTRLFYGLAQSRAGIKMIILTQNILLSNY